MSEEIKVGDRFEWLGPDGTGDIWTIVANVVSGMVDMTNSAGTPGVRTPYAVRHFSDATIWRRLPREPTVEEKRAGLKAGDLIRDPALLCEGMRVDLDYHGIPFGYTLLRRNDDGWWCLNEKHREEVFGFRDRDVTSCKFTFLGYADKPAPEVERCPFFYASNKEAGIQCTLLMGPHACDFGPDADLRYQAATVGVVKLEVTSPPTLTGVSTLARHGIRITGGGAMGTFDYQVETEAPTPPANVLPFRYMPAADDIGNSPYRCPDSAKHDGTQCLTCEGIIAKLMQSGDKDMGPTREAARKVARPAYEPQCGAFVGRVLTPVRR